MGGGVALQDLADLLEAQPRVAREKLLAAAIAEIAEKIRFQLAVGEERGIDLGIVETRHRSGIESDGAGGEEEIRALERAVAKCRGLDHGGIAGEPGTRIGLRKQLRQALVKFQIISDDRRPPRR